MFQNMIKSWFSKYTPDYNDFIKALLQGNVKAMNIQNQNGFTMVLYLA